MEHVRGQLEKRLGHFRRDRAEKSPKFVSFDKVLDSPNLHLIPQTLRLKSMQTVIHDRQTSPQDFIETVDAYCDAIVENALSCLPFDPQIVETSAAGTFEGVSFSANVGFPNSSQRLPFSKFGHLLCFRFVVFRLRDLEILLLIVCEDTKKMCLWESWSSSN